MGSCKKALNVNVPLSFVVSVFVCTCVQHIFYLNFPRFKSFTCHFITYHYHQFLRYLTERAGETPEKEQIEMTEEVAEEKDDSKDTEKGKKKKEPKEKKPKGPNCVETLSAGLNLADRDGKSINTDVCLDVDDVLAEPGSTHGLDPVWQI